MIGVDNVSLSGALLEVAPSSEGCEFASDIEYGSAEYCMKLTEEIHATAVKAPTTAMMAGCPNFWTERRAKDPFAPGLLSALTEGSVARVSKKNVGLAADPFTDVSNRHIRHSKRRRTFWRSETVDRGGATWPRARRKGDGPINSISSALRPPRSVVQKNFDWNMPCLSGASSQFNPALESAGSRLKHCSLSMKWAASTRMKVTRRPQTLHAGKGSPETQVTVCCGR